MFQQSVFYCVITFYCTGPISATLKIVMFISLNLFFSLYKADSTPEPPQRTDSRYTTECHYIQLYATYRFTTNCKRTLCASFLETHLLSFVYHIGVIKLYHGLCCLTLYHTMKLWPLTQQELIRAVIRRLSVCLLYTSRCV